MTMSTQYNGLPANIENNLPTPKTITATTNASPIVATTSGAHGLKPGGVFAVSGCDDPAANGLWIAGAITSNTVELLSYPGGVDSTGTTTGTTGTLYDLSFGTTYAIPSDATDDMDAASVNVALEALGDRTAYLLLRSRVPGHSIEGETLFGEWFSNGAWVGANPGITIASSGAGMLLKLPQGTIIRKISLTIDPATHVNLPASMPQLQLLKNNRDGSNASLWSQTDTSGSVGVYNAAHDIVLDLGAEEEIDNTTYTYTLVFVQESGANSVDTGTIQPARIQLS